MSQLMLRIDGHLLENGIVLQGSLHQTVNNLSQQPLQERRVLENPYFRMELKHNPLHTMWDDMTANHFIGVCFFDGHAKAASYAEILEVLLRPQLKIRRIREDL
jgi:hypothetical protein